MKKTRQKREARNRVRVRTEESRHQRKIQEILTVLGIWQDVRQLSVKADLLDGYSSQIELSLDDCDGLPKWDKNILPALREVLQTATFCCPVLGENYLVHDYFTYVWPLSQRLGEVVKRKLGPSHLLNSLASPDGGVAGADTLANAFNRLVQLLDESLQQSSRIDHYLFSLKWETQRSPKRHVKQHFIVQRTKTEQKMVASDGSNRRMYRCGWPRRPTGDASGVNWADWHSSDMGLTDEDRHYPVFIQGHVFDRLCGRNSRLLSDPDREIEWIYHAFLYQAIENRRISPGCHSTEEFLVEYIFGKYKMGYLVARRYDELILITTFLFLTMNGTPEGDLLWEKLKLTRRDREDLKLDTLETFLDEDIAGDRELVGLLRECGCGDLIQFKLDAGIEDCRMGYAQELRKYLRLDE